MVRSLLLVLLLFVGSAEAQTTLISIPAVISISGVRNFGPASVPIGVTGVQIILDISLASDPLPDLSSLFEGSLDGGASWTTTAGQWIFAAGAKPIDPDTGLSTTTIVTNFSGGDFWNDSNNVNRQLRGNVNIGTPLIIGITVVVFP